MANVAPPVAAPPLTPTAPPRLFIVEDEWIVATDIARCLENAGFRVCGVAHRFDDARAAITAAKPDLALLDIALGDANDGISLARQIWMDDGVPVVIVTAYADDTILARASVPGVLGYLVKPFEDRQLLSTVRIALSCATQVHDSDTYDTRLTAVERGLGQIADMVRRIESLAPRGAAVMTPAPPSNDPESAAFRAAVGTLSAREHEVLAGLLDNRRVSTIADMLCISQHTVRNHLKAIFKKLRVRSQPQLIEACRRAGLLPAGLDADAKVPTAVE